MEVFRLEAWRPWEAHLLDAGWRDLVAADEAALNINTADARILSLAWGLPEDAVGRLLQARWQRPFTRMSDLHDVLGGHARLVPEDGWARLASPVLSIRPTRQEPSRGRNTRSASTQSTACCHPGSFSRRGP